MNATTRFALAGVVAAALLCGASHGLPAEQPGAPETPPRSKNAWTLEEAIEELKLTPRDPYLQYVAMQLARRAGKLDEVAGEVEKLLGSGSEGRAAQADLFSMFAGALAVQEGLQLDTMRGRPVGQRRRDEVVVSGDAAPAPAAVLEGSVPTVQGEAIAAPLDSPACELLPMPQADADSPEAPARNVYRVEDAESICVIAERTLGTGTRWPEILRLNPKLNPEQPIPAGTLIVLPESARVATPSAPAAEAYDTPIIPGIPPGYIPDMPPVDAEGPPPMPPIEENAPPAREKIASPVEMPKAVSGATKCVPVYETCYKNCTQTVYENGKARTITKVIPYTVCRMVPVNETTSSADEETPVLKVKATGASAAKTETPLPAKECKWESISGPSVRLAQLEGPQVKSHPWADMLSGRDPEVSPLSRCVPHDFYFVEFRSVAKLLDVIDSADQWSTFIYSQSVKDARSQRVGERVQRQLALAVDPLSRPFYDLVLDGLAITGSDLFVREGSDVTLLMQVRQEKLFKAQMEKFLAKAAKSRPDARRTTGSMLGVGYIHLATPDRDVCVYAAYPRPGLHVRSNSKVGLRRVLEAIRGTDTAGKAVQRLGETDEYKYLRTLMPRGAKEEDGFVYLSDAFIRHMVSPRLKLAERRRLLAYNHLRLIGHAAQLYRTEQGKAPASLDDLAAADCCPGKFNEGELKAPDGGYYCLSADGTSGVCARRGTVRFLTPCCEIPVKGYVTHDEAAAYQTFVDQYSEYWRTYFDPIAIRVQVQPKRVRFETIVLPLIDNTVYTFLSKFLGGEPEHLDALPVPKRNLFSLAVRPNWEALLKESNEGQWGDLQRMIGLLNNDPETLARSLGVMLTLPLSQPETALPCVMTWAELEQASEKAKSSPLDALGLSAGRLLTGGLGNQVGLHVYDQGVPFDLNLATFLGQMMGSFNGNGTDTAGAVANLGVMAIAVPVAACTAPGYLAITVKNEKIVDDFLAQVDKVMPALKGELQGAIGPTIGIEGDYYKLTLKGGVTARSFTLRVGPARFRLHLARIGKGLYLTNHASVLEDLQAAEAAWRESQGPKSRLVRDLGPKAHAMVRMRARNWDQALPGFRLSWAENNRQACHGNLGPLSGIARAVSAMPPGVTPPPTGSWNDREAPACPAGAPRWPEHLGKFGFWEDHSRETLEYAARVYGTYHVCPDGGRYVLAADGKSVVCTVHGSLQEPRQGMAPADDSPTGRLMRDFADLTAGLTFTPEGLRAVLTIERK